MKKTISLLPLSILKEKYYKINIYAIKKPLNYHVK